MLFQLEDELIQEFTDLEYVKYYGASDSKAEIAITLSKARRESGKTQQEVADVMGLSQPYISKLEGGEANPTIGTIGSLLAILGYRLKANVINLLPDKFKVSERMIPVTNLNAAGDFDLYQSAFVNALNDYSKITLVADRKITGIIASADIADIDMSNQEDSRLLVAAGGE